MFSQKLKQFHWQIFNLCEGECGLDLEGDELGPLLDHQLQLLGVAHLQVFYCDDSAEHFCTRPTEECTNCAVVKVVSPAPRLPQGSDLQV